MKTIYVKDCKKGLILNGEAFAVYEVRKNNDKNGKPYIDILVGDKTGKIKGKIWNDSIQNIEKGALKVDGLISIFGRVDEFKGTAQLTINEIKKVDEGAMDDFIKSSEFDAGEMMDELKTEVNSIKDAGIKKVVLNIINDEELGRRLKFWTAARSVHHDFRSGLLQHILEMISISKGLQRFYPNINYDILLAGIVLHDIGKLEELDASGLSTTYTKKGSLIGHIVIGTQIFEKFGGKELPENTYLHIEHLILSHHGTHAFGSPVVPATVEAIMLSYIDDLSAKSRTATSAIDDISDGEDFSGYNMWLEGAKLWKGGITTIVSDQDTIEEDVDQMSLV